MYKDNTKAQIVDYINALPGPPVTTRARKDTLIEILEQREADVKASIDAFLPTPTLWDRILGWFK